ncbi:redoxin domain-containing protein [Pseudoteredinibacter isoporae]|uniref:Peroxiredoxin n=1 Tax=Pseudoteredinibacter isoporae TaxID=570281 RepID=A0A7X0JTB7_9GAMM|nr:redoxin domain-containing protein [Pseudoteredinibacter isoporae]MBB6521885.1 peroxiredoxin [Pseudoteredinibacter isoporae]NHO87429.1 redoxin domain-containing protein [Pseudoteredinibacter isoporae]NIB24240.1 redoxin domain-containing protein [Pseudoteredinibacter isoporae]
MPHISTPTEPLKEGQRLPEIFVYNDNGSLFSLSSPNADLRWRIILLHRGKRCQVCKLYLEQWSKHSEALSDLGIELIAASGDPRKPEASNDDALPGVKYGYGLSRKHLNALGAYTYLDSKANRLQPEPAVILIDQHGDVKMSHYSSSPFLQANINLLLSGIRWLNLTEAKQQSASLATAAN